jgi:hypothetical protein
LKAQCREVLESAAISSCIEPLEEAPKEAKQKEFS